MKPDVIDLTCLHTQNGGREGRIAKQLYEQYIIRRKPFVIRGSLPDHEWKGNEWTNQYLCKKAGQARVKVEKRDSSAGRYGMGQEVLMTMGDFVQELEKGNELLYLTTQDLDGGVEEPPALMSSPLTELQNDFPLRPILMGRLIPQSMTLWMGHSQRGSSSGLHHDYHDNLYILLRGKKCFRLYGPDQAERMYPVGQLARIHANGRINYQGHLTEADGRTLGAERARAASRALEKAALFDGEGAEEDMEAALAEVLETEMGRQREEEEEGNEFKTCEGPAEEEEEDDWGEGDGIDGAGLTGRERGEEQATWGRRDWLSRAENGRGPGENMGRSAPKRARCGERGGGEGSNERAKGPYGNLHGSERGCHLAHNFSRVLDSSNVDRQAFPDFPCSPALEFQLQVGELLYLPAGWFHEVTSHGGEHMALNYWFHPPDNPMAWDHPYLSPFWQDEWEERIMEGQSMEQEVAVQLTQ